MAHPKNQKQQRKSQPPPQGSEAPAVTSLGEPSISPTEAIVVSVRLRDPMGSPVYSCIYVFHGSEAKRIELAFLRAMGPDYVAHLVNHPELIVEVIE